MSRPTDHATGDDPSPRALLPAAAYWSPEWFAREQELLFERTWTHVALEADVAEPGDYLATTVGRAPIVLVRDHGGELRAFHNLCRHRGLPVLDGSGTCGRGIVCPYHRWNYGLDGSLRAVPRREQFGDIVEAELGLLPVECDTWKGMVFVRVAGTGPALAEWLGPLDDTFTRFEPTALVEGFRVEHRVRANWKLIVENHVDWLHLWYVHADTLADFDHAAGERAEHGPHWTSFEPVRSVDDSASTADDETGLLPLPGLTEADRRLGAHLVFPTTALITEATFWQVWRIVPTGPETTSMDLRVLVDPAGHDDQLGVGLEQVMREDYSVSEAIQRGVRSPVWSVGPLAVDYEREIWRFQRAYLGHVDPPNHAES